MPTKKQIQPDAPDETPDDGLGPRIPFSINGEKGMLYLDRVTPADARALRQGMGVGLNQLLNTTLDFDVFAAFAWLVRRQNDEPNLPFAEGTSKFRYSDDWRFLTREEYEKGEAPQS